jgi:GNAT superfamily N-acetyltransferase
VTAVENKTLIGLARCVSDDATIAYIQDILVHPDHQRKGIGKALVEAVLHRYAHVRQKVLLTDDRPEQLRFYETLGFRNTRELEKTPLNAFIRMDGVTLS